ncbi:MAG: L-threonylcarbamoyladenylate synthase [Leptolyngbyaceae cyanobacterium bins.59]|nr:L-threonylcarbamoyladenylate synthase [Leptolyngbyaceae cyanobacterium bins.59]
MAKIYTVHPETPQTRIIDQIKDALRQGAVMLYPTDTVYAIGCDLQSKSAIERVRQLKQMSNDKPLTFLCPSLSNIAHYAVVSDNAYRIMKRLIPGPYTFLLPATKLVPKLVMNPKRRSTGIRVPDQQVCQALLKALDNPIISTSAHLPGDEDNPVDPEARVDRFELFDRLDRVVDVIIDDDSSLSNQVSTILDLTTNDPVVVRRGSGWDAIHNWDLEFAEEAH